MESWRWDPNSRPYSHLNSHRFGALRVLATALYISLPAIADACIASIQRVRPASCGPLSSRKYSRLLSMQRAWFTRARRPTGRSIALNHQERRPSISLPQPNTSGRCALARTARCSQAPAIKARFSRSPPLARAKSIMKLANRTLLVWPLTTSGACLPVAIRMESSTGFPVRAKPPFSMIPVCLRFELLPRVPMAPFTSPR